MACCAGSYDTKKKGGCCRTLRPSLYIFSRAHGGQPSLGLPVIILQFAKGMGANCGKEEEPETAGDEGALGSEAKFVFVLGGPGSGKGTQSVRLTDEFGLVHLSVGELLREEQNREGSKDGAIIKEHIEQGTIVPKEVVDHVLKMAMEREPEKLHLLDGFPRALDQAEDFMKQVGKPQFVLFFDVSKETMTERILERGKTSGRADDNLESLAKRLDTYHKVSMPVIEKFEQMGLVRKISAEESIDQTYAEARKLFAEM